MNRKKTPLTILALLFAGSAMMTSAARAQDTDPGMPKQPDMPKPVDNYAVEWSDPSVFGAHWRHVGASLTGVGYYATWEGREFQMTEGMLTVTPARWLTVWYGDDRFFALGQHKVTRLNVSSDTYGFRAVLVPPDSGELGGFAVQVQAWRPGTARIVSGLNSEEFAGTEDLAYALMGSTLGYDYQVQYYSIKQPLADSKADVFDLALGRDFAAHGSKFQLRAEAHGLYQSIHTDAEDDKSLRFLAHGGAGYDITPAIRLEGEVNVMPFGVGFASGELTPLTGFLVDNPGDPVNELKSSFFAVAALRLTYHVHF